jgi:hypothetical protein
VVHVTTDKSQQERTWVVGLDETYHRLPSGEASRGGWVDPQTFTFELYDVDTQTYTATFEEDRVVIESPELGIKIEGEQQNP